MTLSLNNLRLGTTRRFKSLAKQSFRDVISMTFRGHRVSASRRCIAAPGRCLHRSQSVRPAGSLPSINGSNAPSAPATNFSTIAAATMRSVSPVSVRSKPSQRSSCGNTEPGKHRSAHCRGQVDIPLPRVMSSYGPKLTRTETIGNFAVPSRDGDSETKFLLACVETFYALREIILEL
jgi:hypothetical protein